MKVTKIYALTKEDVLINALFVIDDNYGLFYDSLRDKEEEDQWVIPSKEEVDKIADMDLKEQFFAKEVSNGEILRQLLFIPETLKEIEEKYTDISIKIKKD